MPLDRLGHRVWMAKKKTEVEHESSRLLSASRGGLTGNRYSLHVCVVTLRSYCDISIFDLMTLNMRNVLP